ncbi:MAG TPA: CvpA family protein [Mizugakiibacter sp.]|nr:CvpA family protein [Mizugakiibacter sp.]
MNIADYTILAVVVLSVLIGLWRGLVAEVLALAVWGVALWSAWMFGNAVAGHLPDGIHEPSARIFIAWGLIFVAVLVLGALLSWLLRMLVESTGLSGSDRMLGMVFGLTRGLVIVTLTVLLLGFTPFPRDTWWQHSTLIPTFQSAATMISRRMPAKVSRYIDFRPPPLPILSRPALAAPPAAPSASRRSALHEH